MNLVKCSILTDASQIEPDDLDLTSFAFAECRIFFPARFYVFCLAKITDSDICFLLSLLFLSYPGRAVWSILVRVLTTS